MPLSEKRKQSMRKYAKENIRRIPLDVQKTEYDQIKSAATASGESVNGYIKTAVRQRMQRDSNQSE